MTKQRVLSREDEKSLLRIEGELTHIIFQARDSAYTVGLFKTDQGRVTAAGPLPGAMTGQKWILEGDWSEHPKYGRQFKIYVSALSPVQKSEHLIAYFSGEAFKGIGVKLAEKIVQSLGEDAVEKIADDPDILITEAGLTEKQKDAVVTGIEEMKIDGETVLKLLSWGLSDKSIARLQDSGKPIKFMLEKDCFAPLYEIRQFGYDDTIRIANGMQVPNDDIRRLMASIYIYVQEQCLKSGDTFIDRQAIEYEYGHLPKEIVDQAVDRLIEEDRLEGENGRVYPYHFLSEENYIASKLSLLQVPLVQDTEADLDEIITEFEQEEKIAYDPLQKEAIATFFEHPLMILNGGPGTGKSTVVKGIVHALKALYPASLIQLCAPTGRAAKRLGELTEIQAKTIHSLLGWDMERDSFAKGELDPLNVDFLIVDEFSMVATHVFYSLLKALTRGCRILLIGDEDQLESVGPGNVLSDLINSKTIPVCSLQTLFRQSEGSSIARLAREIRDEQTPSYEEDCSFQPLEASEICGYLKEKVQQLPDFSSFQILAPKYAGAAGIDRINDEMQKIINPFSPNKLQLIKANTVFRQGDRVLLKKNLPEEGVFNGDIGEIIEVDPSGDSLVVEFDEAEVQFERDISLMLSHAWCISIHKAQGSEYRDVFLVCSDEAGFMLSKKLLYTGVSRAKRHLEILGKRSVFERGIRMTNSHLRRTTLKPKMKKAFE